MAQINLLKQTTVSQDLWQVLPSWAVKILAVAAIGVLGYYGYLFITIRSTEKTINQLRQDIVNTKNQALQEPMRDELITRQAQIKQLGALIGGHNYLSEIFAVLAESTLKTASFSDMKITPEGKLALSVTVPDLVELDKFLQVFDQPKFYANFSDVKMGGFRKAQSENGLSYKFDVSMRFNPAIISHDHFLNSVKK